jgi:hypothetical protein
MKNKILLILIQMVVFFAVLCLFDLIFDKGIDYLQNIIATVIFAVLIAVFELRKKTK